MNEKTRSTPELHSDHRHWKSEIEMWHEDVSNWRNERDSAMKQLKEVADMVLAQNDLIDRHAHKIDVIADALDYHEKTLSESLRGGSDPDLDDALQERHDEQRRAVAKQRTLHESMKKHHHETMAKVAMLRSATHPEL